MTVALPVRAHLKSVPSAYSPVATRKVSTVPALQANWARMLADITTLGQINADVSNPAVRLRFSAEPWSAFLAGASARVHGPGINLLALTDRWASATIAREAGGDCYEHLAIHDHLGDRLLRLSLTEESNWAKFGSLVVSQWARHAAPTGLPDHAELVAALMLLEQHAGAALPIPLVDEWFDVDRPKVAGTRVDASLLAPFLETLANQECPLTLRLGNSGLLLQHETGFFDFHQLGDRLKLRSPGTRLEIATDQLAVAMIVDGRGCAGERWLRLYDDACRCVLVIGLGRCAEPEDASLWQCMLRALRE